MHPHMKRNAAVSVGIAIFLSLSFTTAKTAQWVEKPNLEGDEVFDFKYDVQSIKKDGSGLLSVDTFNGYDGAKVIVLDCKHRTAGNLGQALKAVPPDSLSGWLIAQLCK